jgi:hypothetical protein
VSRPSQDKSLTLHQSDSKLLNVLAGETLQQQKIPGRTFFWDIWDQFE